jgi:type II restriction enzyme
VLLSCDIAAAIGYTSQAQASRVLSEAWFRDNGYCLSCRCERLQQTPANTKASDFICERCEERYELKAFVARPRRTLVDGAYSALISRIRSGTVPTLMLLERDPCWRIQSLTAIHPMFLTSSVVEKRKPLSQNARRAGWVGCNIRLDLIGPDAQVSVIDRGVVVDRRHVRNSFRKFKRLGEVSPDLRGWSTLTLAAVRSLNREEFSLGDLYSKEETFATVYPTNSNLRAKVRQQLQVLRDLGYLEFLGRGRYRLLL